MITIGTLKPGMGVPPAVILVNTKYGHNAASALRCCSTYGVGQLWITGSRWAEGWDKRMPREERMRAYGDVDVYRCEEPLRAFERDATPVAVEFTRNAESLPFFQWPANPVFVLGPEDGSLPDWARRNCHRHVTIPTRHCLNLSVALGTVLYDWHAKRLRAGLDDIVADLGRKSAELDERLRGFHDGDEQLTWPVS